MRETTRRRLTRVAAPTAFLAAATVAILLVRPALDPAAEDVPTRPVATTTGSASGTAPPDGDGARPPRFVRVGRGDTLESIAARTGTTVESLLTLNPQIDPVAMRVGQRVRVR